MTAITISAPERQWRQFWRRYRENRAALAALCVLVFLLAVAVFGNWIAPHDPNAQSLRDALAGPLTDSHLLGTDELGRDTLSRLIAATRVAMLAAGQATLVALVLGVPPGLIAGYFGGWIDVAIMRITDAVQSFIPLLLAVSLVGILGPGLRNAMLAIGVIFAPGFLRVLRSAVLEVREETYIEASHSIGTPTSRIIWERVLPNVLPPLFVQVSLALGFSLLAEASLSFLGLGVQPPEASWGSMLGRGYENLRVQPWLMIFPGILIAVTVLCFNLVGDGLRDTIGREVTRER